MSKRVNNKRGNRAKRKMLGGQTTKVRGNSHVPHRPVTWTDFPSYPRPRTGKGWLDMEKRILLGGW